MKLERAHDHGGANVRGAPDGAVRWLIGPDSPPGADGLPTRISDVWGGLALYHDRRAAEAALENTESFLPFEGETLESWHAALVPIRHHGQINVLNEADPGEIFEPAPTDPGGPLVILTSVGFHYGPDTDWQRIKYFLESVVRVRAQIADAPGLAAQHAFQLGSRTCDSVTMTLWREDAAVSDFAYGTGRHRTELERYKRENTADRTSFTRCRVLQSKGTWDGRDPVRPI